MKKRKICVVTGTRAEFGLLFWILKELQNDKNVHLQIIATGMHLSPEFGLTYKEIENQGFKITKKIEILLSSDSPIGISKSMGLTNISISEVFDELKPDICLILGDRFEVFSVATAAMVSRIPIAHIHGGEATEGLIDEAIRHSITKMSHLHFVATNEYRKRVIQLGESPDRVFNFGSPGIDNIYNLNLLSKKEFEKSINFKLSKLNFLVTYHPVTLEKNSSELQFKELLSALSNFKNAKIIFTMPNSDTYGRVIIELIKKYVSKNLKSSIAFNSLGQLKYLSALKHVSMVIGNSSSGLTEVPSFKIPTINIGDRQNGRIKSKSVIDCSPNKKNIIESINLGLSKEFKSDLLNSINLYGTSGASKKIKDKLKSYPLKNILKKKFYNL